LSADFAISQVSPVTSLLTPAGGSNTAKAFTAAQAPAVINSGPPAINPSLHVDPALNLVVLQFFDARGDVEQSIPSQRQLEAYRQDGGQTPTGITSSLS
jgi:hypothetical protein